MARLNAQGQALLGRGSGPASVDGRVVITPGGGPASWLNHGAILVNTGADPHWDVVAVSVEDPTLRFLFHAGGANDLVAGGDRWLGWNPVDGLFGTLPPPPPDDPGKWARAGVRGAGLDGTLAYCPDRQVGRGLVLLAPDGATREVPGASVFDEYSLQVLGPQSALWYDGAQVRTTPDLPPLDFAVPPGKARLARLPGEDWLVYWAPALGALVAQLNGAPDGYVLQQGPIAFNHDALAVGGEVVVAWSVTQGEGPGDYRKVTVDRSQPRVPLAPAPSQPVFHFTHPVLLAPFRAEGSGCPDIMAQGIYTEAPDPSAALAEAAATGQRLLLAHDSPADWTLPPGLRPCDIPLLEYYRLPEETLDQSAARWTRQTDALLAQWPGTIGVIPMCYTQFRWTIQQVLDGLAWLSPLVNRSPRIQLLAPFAYNRANGIVSDPDLLAMFARLRAAADAAGLATLPPVEAPEPEPPDPPEPEPPDVPPAQPGKDPMEPFAAALRLGAHFFTRVDPTPGLAPWPDWCLVRADRTDPHAPDCRWDITEPEPGNPKLRARHVATGRTLTMDFTKHGGNVCQGFFGSPDSAGWGGYQQLSGWQFGPGGPEILTVDYAIISEQGVAPCLTVVRL